ncbi:phospholipase a2-activating protein [Anaeramoeba flamelloides]|uniref:Phospholipase a2-activating protein n=1 Tax=Anaeramoeba flamelloides TaxID=1746091 RepID=A0AAV7Y5U5_9EUKA|nr:phospholipase a2-activating protein [Anaeramoeba flamelloides]
MSFGDFNLSNRLQLGTGFLSSISVFISGNIVASSGRNLFLYIRSPDSNTFQKIANFQGEYCHSHETISCVYAIEKGIIQDLEEETFLVCIGQMMNLYSVKSVQQMKANQEPKALWWIFGHTANISCVTVCPNGLIYSGSYDQTIHVDQYTNKEKKIILKGHTGSINNLIHINNVVVSSSTDDTIRIWKNFQQVKVISNEMTRNVSSLAPCCDYGFLSANNTNHIAYFTLEGKLFMNLFAGNSQVNRVYTSPLGLKEYYAFGPNVTHILSYSQVIATPSLKQYPKFMIPYTKPPTMQGKKIDPNDPKDLYEKCYGEDLILAFSDGEILILTKNSDRVTQRFAPFTKELKKSKDTIRDLKVIKNTKCRIDNQVRVVYDFSHKKNNKKKLTVLCWKNNSQNWTQLGKINSGLDFIDEKNFQKIKPKKKKKNDFYYHNDSDDLDENTGIYTSKIMENIKRVHQIHSVISKSPYNSKKILNIVKGFAMDESLSDSKLKKINKISKFAKKQLSFYKTKFKQAKGYKRIYKYPFTDSHENLWFGYNPEDDTQNIVNRLIKEHSEDTIYITSIYETLEEQKSFIMKNGLDKIILPKKDYESLPKGNVDKSFKKLEELNISIQQEQFTENELNSLRTLIDVYNLTQNNVIVNYNILPTLLYKCNDSMFPKLLDFYRVLIHSTTICSILFQDNFFINLLFEKFERYIKNQDKNSSLACLKILLDLFAQHITEKIIQKNNFLLIIRIKQLLNTTTDYHIKELCLQILVNLSIQNKKNISKYFKGLARKKLNLEFQFQFLLIDLLVGNIKDITEEDLLFILFTALGTLLFSNDSVQLYLVSKNFLSILQTYRNKYSIKLSTIIDEILRKIIKITYNN